MSNAIEAATCVGLGVLLVVVCFRLFELVLACVSWRSVMIWDRKGRLERQWNDAEVELELELE